MPDILKWPRSLHKRIRYVSWIVTWIGMLAFTAAMLLDGTNASPDSPPSWYVSFTAVWFLAGAIGVAAASFWEGATSTPRRSGAPIGTSLARLRPDKAA